MTIVRGGKTVYGAAIGMLMLETRFPRIPGDAANARSFDFPIQYRIVRGASADRVIRRDPRALTDAFVEAGRELIEMGCEGLTTTCGFLSLIQQPLAERLGVPIAASSLMQIPIIRASLAPGGRVGVMTISAPHLRPEHLEAAGAPPDTPIVGLEGGAFARAILEDAATLDVEASRAEHLEAADRLIEGHSDLGAIVMECANMAPYAADVRARTGLPVFTIKSLVDWLRAGLEPERFSRAIDDPR